ncbi:MAG: decaprenyl-phosphate phosphoribosyltransferase [Kiritimatiellae bacterium]|nr:decaprenyl-phosphate phosphoribosyltransferase [Kiritimatiellia bacterium]
MSSGGQQSASKPNAKTLDHQAGTGRPVRVPALVLALRPAQWTKNAVIFAAFFFAYWDRTRQTQLTLDDLIFRVLPAVILFCLLSSAAYLFNDVLDLALDRGHPTKRWRPIAAGQVSTTVATGVSFILLILTLPSAWYLSRPFGTVALTYMVMQAAYSLWLKHVPLLDVLVIASGFVLRAIAGAVVLDRVTISPWLLLCTFLLALFLALCKRRHEKLLFNNDSSLAGPQRPSLGKYDETLLDQLIATSAGATIVSYAIYTLWPHTVEKFGTNALGFTIPFVVFGVFRYLDLAYRHEKGDRPEKVLLTDVPILVNILLYVVAVAVILLFHPGTT